MNGYEVCTACACLIKAHESKCPFCAAARTATAPSILKALPRTSRAQWLALCSTLAMAGCSGEAPPATQDAGAADGHTSNGDAATTPVPQGTLACGASNGVQTCSRASQYCMIDANARASCVDFATSPCAASHTCACVDKVLNDPVHCGCGDDGSGGIEASCSPCYGSPPARLERKIARRRRADSARSRAT